jgi:hypothetical protein
MPRRRATPQPAVATPPVTTIAMNDAIVTVPSEIVTDLVSMRDSSHNVQQSFSDRPIATVSEAEFINTIHARATQVKRAVEQFFAPHKQRAYEAHRALCASERQTLTPVNTAIALCQSLLTSWNRRETERLRLEALGEAEMLNALDQALNGADASNQAVTVAAEQAVEPVSVVAAPALPGATFVTRYVAVVDDFHALVQSVARGESSIDLLLPNQERLDSVAREMRHDMRIPGVRAAEVDGMRRSRQ